MDFWKLRVETSHTPGQLAEISRALAAVGANIVSLDVHTVDASTVADELVVALTVPIDVPLLAFVLEPLDVVLTDLRPADRHELVDPVAHAIEAAGTAMQEPITCASLGAALGRVVGADVAFVRPQLRGLPLVGAAATAVEEQRPVLAREAVKHLGAAPEGAWVLAAPALLDTRPHVAVLVRCSPRFSFTETARLQAILAVAAGVTARSGAANGASVGLEDGGEIVVRRLQPSDESAVVRMHRRCRPQTLQRRYLSTMTDLPPRLLRIIMGGDDDGRLALAAVVGSEVVGIAHLGRPSPSSAEIALLVEDGHQRRGVGSALLTECVRHAAACGVATITATCQSDNAAFPRLVARCGFAYTSTLADGLRELSFPPTTAAARPASAAVPSS